MVAVQAGATLLLLRCSGAKLELVTSVQGASMSEKRSASAAGNNRLTLLGGKEMQESMAHPPGVCVVRLVSLEQPSMPNGLLLINAESEPCT